MRIVINVGNTLALKLPPEINARLEALAVATGRTKSFYVREAILTHLDDLEDAYRAEQALVEWRRSGEPLVDHDAVVREFLPVEAE